jgi:hypothetical protein
MEDNEKQELLDALRELNDEFVMQIALRFNKSPSDVMSKHPLVIRINNIIAKYSIIDEKNKLVLPPIDEDLIYRMI